MQSWTKDYRKTQEFSLMIVLLSEKLYHVPTYKASLNDI